MLPLMLVSARCPLTQNLMFLIGFPAKSYFERNVMSNFTDCGEQANSEI